MANPFGTLLNNLRKSLGLSKSNTPPKRPRKPARPRLELLEDRTAPATFGTVQGTLFLDANNNGILNTNEARVPGVKVSLIGTQTGANDNTSIQVTTTTNASGVYKFTNVPEGTYKLQTSAVAGITQGAAKTFTGVSIATNGQIFTHNFAYKGGVVVNGFTMRQFLTNAKASGLPYGAAGAGTSIANHTPVVSKAFTTVNTTSSAANTVLDLAGNFKDGNTTNSLVTFHITNGTTTSTIKMILFDTQTPQTVQNFLDYVLSNKYDQSIFHRNAKKTTDGIGVLQGGAMTVDGTGKVLTDVAVTPAGSTVPNEFLAINKNLAGTIAMAQSSGINSATNQFFFNTTNNATALDPQKFAVFGKVADTASMNALLALAQTPTKDLTGGAFAALHPTSLLNNVPMNNYSGSSASFPTDAVLSNYMRITDISVEKRSEFLTYSLVGANGGADTQIAAVSLTNEYLTIDPLSAGTTSITVKATDRYGAEVTAVINITVTGNHAPVATDGTLTATEDADQGGVLTATDQDAGNILTYSIVSGPSKGTVELNNANSGAYTFKPGLAFQNLAAGQTETVTFTFKAADNLGVSSLVKTVTVTVTGVNDKPVGADASLATDQDNTVSGTLTATDIDVGDTIASFAILAQPSEGSVTLTPGTGAFTFDPDGDFDDVGTGDQAQVTFTYTATDNNGGVSDSKMITITVNGLNDAPTANDGVLAATASGTTPGNLTGNDPDTGDTISFSLGATAPAKGSVAIDSATTGAYTFDPGSDFANLNAGESEGVNFSYLVTDNHTVPSAEKTITVTVTAVPIIASAPITPDNAANVQVLTVNPTISNQGSVTVTFSYKWRQNGIEIAGATSQTLDLSTTTVSVGDTFDVLVTAHAGTATSAEFTSPIVTVISVNPTLIA